MWVFDDIFEYDELTSQNKILCRGLMVAMHTQFVEIHTEKSNNINYQIHVFVYVGLLMDCVGSGGHLVVSYVGILIYMRPKHLKQGFLGRECVKVTRFTYKSIHKNRKVFGVVGSRYFI